MERTSRKTLSTKDVIAPEAIEQQALFSWAQFHAVVRDHLFAIPNGGSRHKAEAANLKRQGVIPGIPDMFLAVARKPFHGLFIELKSKYKYSCTSPRQEIMIERFNKAKYKAVICRGWEQAVDEIQKYLKNKSWLD